MHRNLGNADGSAEVIRFGDRRGKRLQVGKRRSGMTGFRKCSSNLLIRRLMLTLSLLPILDLWRKMSRGGCDFANHSHVHECKQR